MFQSRPKCLALTLFVFAIASLQFVASQESETDDHFQDHHQDLGRISGGATSTVAAARAPVIRHDPVASTHRAQPARVSNIQSNQNRAPPRRDAIQPKRNRITLAVRPHTPAPEAQLETVPAPIPFQITQPILTSIPPSHGASSQEQDSHAALMAQVAAERQATAPREPEPMPIESSAPSGSSQQAHRGSIGSPLAALSSPTFTQVIAPATFSSSASQTIRQPSISIADSKPAESVEEPVEAPSFQSVLNQGCPRKGVFSWENKDHCDRYYMCTNGTFTEEACPNGLSYSQMGEVYQHCAYNWNVECGQKKSPGPIASPGCPWQFGIFPIASNGQCSVDYYVCEWGLPETKRCHPEGLFYDERIKGCQWADQLGCKSEALLNFKCPLEDEDNPYWPYPRYYHNKQDIIVCVNEQPRLVHCNEEQVVDPNSLACMELKKKNKKKPQ